MDEPFSNLNVHLCKDHREGIAMIIKITVDNRVTSNCHTSSLKNNSCISMKPKNMIKQSEKITINKIS